MLTIKTNAQANKTILVVEDSPTQAMHLQLMLEEVGLQVMCASSGRVGLQLAQQLKPDLIVLDVQLPDLNGFEVCQQLKSAEDTLAIPVIMLTRHDEPTAVANGLEAGVADYIPKDAFADVVLLETLRQMGLIEP